MQLLHRRYAIQNQHSLQPVPDKDRGDLGMEAFSFDGCIYQCYAAEEPIDVKTRFKKQRDKLTTDLGKLRNKQDAVQLLLGQVVLRRYVFLVPKHDSKELISHAHTKAAEVVGWGLPFIAPDFTIVIETDDAYATERRDIHAIPNAVIQVVDVEEDYRLAWQSSNADFRDTARAKLGKVIPSEATRDGILDVLTSQYLEGENALERLRSIQPELHGSLLRERARTEQKLALKYSAGGQGSHGILSQIESDFEQTLLARYPTLTSEIAELLAWASVAYWLMRCPLDLEAAS